MYEIFYDDYGDEIVRKVVTRKVPATERKDMARIENALRMKAESEANKLYRLAWRMTRHGCSKESIERCRDEARRLHRVGGMNLWDILNPFVCWEFAFKC